MKTKKETKVIKITSNACKKSGCSTDTDILPKMVPLNIPTSFKKAA